MSEYLDRAKALRNAADVHYNCAQSVLLAFAPEAGLTREQALGAAGAFGSGMQMGETCGAFTGGLMVLGLFGCSDGQAVTELREALKKNHGGMFRCADLLRVNKERGGQKKPHCDGMVYEAVELVEKILRERGKIA